MKTLSLEETPDNVEMSNNLFISKEWLSIIKKTYNIDFEFVTDNHFQNILPFCVIKNDYFNAVKSIPFSDYTLINYSDNFLSESLLFLKEKYPNHYIETTVINKNNPIVQGFTSTITGFLIQIDIPTWKKSFVWKDTYERNIRKAINIGLEIRISNNKSSIENFYLLHEQLRINKFRKLPQPRIFFENIYDYLIKQDKGFFLEVWYKKTMLASWLIIKYNKTLYYKFGASDINYLNMRPNDLLFRSLMQYGSEHGFQTIDLGYSGASKNYEGLLRFKRKEGGEKSNFYQIEYFPEDFPKHLLTKRKEHLNKITQDSLETGSIERIRTTSNHYYKHFA